MKKLFLVLAVLFLTSTSDVSAFSGGKCSELKRGSENAFDLYKDFANDGIEKHKNGQIDQDLLDRYIATAENWLLQSANLANIYSAFCKNELN